ncbi:MAG: hypothetical protein Q9201_004028 [Fulgogasparrea decipioides]
MILNIFLILVVVNWAGAVPGCWRQNPPDRQQLQPTIFKQCLEIAKFLAKVDKTDAPVSFSRRPGIGYKVPQHWVIGTCVATLDMHSDEDEDTASFMEIAIETGTLSAACVAKPPHLGGTAVLGPKKVMNITILGLELPGNRVSLSADS